MIVLLVSVVALLVFGAGPALAQTVTGVSPTAGSAAGGNTVTITGSDFIGALEVDFGSTPATAFTVDSDTSITATAPPGTGTVDITVTGLLGTSSTGTADEYTYGPPTITTLLPTAGSTGGGTTVTITGTGFTTDSAVDFGGTTINSPTFISSTELQVTSPSGTAGSAQITVSNPDGASSGANFVYGTPTVTSVSPTAGATGGGNTVTVNGTGFTSDSTVNFGPSNPGTSVSVNPAGTQLTVLAPLGLGTVDVTVANPVGPSTTSSADLYTYGAPTVTGVSPTAGPTGGGNTVTVNGTGFTTDSTVDFGPSNPGSSVSVNPAGTQLTVTAPSGSGAVSVTVVTPAGTSATGPADKYVYGAPTVTGVSPTAGPTGGGNTVTITGTGFTTDSTVNFGSNPATGVVINNPTSITATAPAGTGTVNVTVTNPVGTSTTNNADHYTYDPTPTVATVSPAAGPTAGGTSVTITGTGFTGATAVSFGSAPATFTLNNDGSITAVSPPGSGQLQVTVSTPGGTSNSVAFSYNAVPVIAAISPTSGPTNGATAITITGTGFTSGSTVSFGGVKVPVTFNSSTSLSVVSPPGSGTVDLVVSTPGGTSATGPADRFTYFVPAIPPPVLLTGSVTGLGRTTATLNGTVDPAGQTITSCEFHYGTTTQVTDTAACVDGTGTPVPVRAQLTGLKAATTYHFELVATSAGGTSTSSQTTFTTSQLPLVSPPHVGLLVLRVQSGRYFAELLGLQGISGAAIGESLLIHCVAACQHPVNTKIPLRKKRDLSRRISLSRGLLLSSATRIDIDVSAKGKLSRYASYAFYVSHGSLGVRVAKTGCISGTKIQKCPAGDSTSRRATVRALLIRGPQ